MSPATLYRAAAPVPHLGTGSHWTPSRDAAQAYRANPGFGGSVLYRADVDAAHALDLRGASWRDLAEELLTDEEFASWAAQRDLDHPADLAAWLKSLAPGAHLYETWEASGAVCDALARGYDWVRYIDSYPLGCETWRYLGTAPVAAEAL